MFKYVSNDLFCFVVHRFLCVASVRKLTIFTYLHLLIPSGLCALWVWTSLSGPWGKGPLQAERKICPVEIRGNPWEMRTYRFLCIWEKHFYCGYYWTDNQKAPENCSASVWAYSFPICFWEKPKPKIFMISRFVDPWEPLFIDLKMPKYYTNAKNWWGNVFKMVFLQRSKSWK